MNVSLQDAVLVLLPCAAGLTWLLRLEGRINVTDAQFTEIIRRLERIEKRQDDA
jgi:hypothetical protein